MFAVVIAVSLVLHDPIAADGHQDVVLNPAPLNLDLPRRVVVGVDSSLSSRVALEHAVHRVGARGSLIVAHVLPPLTNAISGAVAELEEERHALAHELVDRLASDHAVESDPIVLDGRPLGRSSPQPMRATPTRS